MRTKICRFDVSKNPQKVKLNTQ